MVEEADKLLSEINQLIKECEVDFEKVQILSEGITKKSELARSKYEKLQLLVRVAKEISQVDGN